MIRDAEFKDGQGNQDFCIGARAIVSTGRFRCLAVLEEDGDWHEVYGTGQTLDVVQVLDPV